MQTPRDPNAEESKALADLRREYTRHGLIEADADPDPLRQFRLWLDQALAAGVHEPTAMVLATATPDGRPSARVVLLKGLDEHGFTFFTNYSSRKGQELTVNPRAALTFFWPQLERQVRVEGAVAAVTSAESDDYHRSRPRDSQLGAWTSEQSEVIASRSVLEDRLAGLRSRFGSGDVPRPPYWGGYRLVPESVEFWQGRPARLHDRLFYLRTPPGDWQRVRLAP
jgi:pyridoxamine 5'-phosphate oxidase